MLVAATTRGLSRCRRVQVLRQLQERRVHRRRLELWRRTFGVVFSTLEAILLPRLLDLTTLISLSLTPLLFMTGTTYITTTRSIRFVTTVTPYKIFKSSNSPTVYDWYDIHHINTIYHNTLPFRNPADPYTIVCTYYCNWSVRLRHVKVVVWITF